MEYNPLKYFWAVVLKNGEELWQFNPETGVEKLIKDVPLLDVKTIHLLNFNEHMTERIHQATGKLVIPSNLPPHCVEIEDGQRPIIFRTNAIRMGPQPHQKPRETLYCIGFQETVDGRNHQVIMTVDENGRCFLGHPQTRKVPNYYVNLYSARTTEPSEDEE